MNTTEAWDRARAHLLTSAEVKRQVVEKCVDSILAAADLIARTFQSGGKVLLCGMVGVQPIANTWLPSL